MALVGTTSWITRSQGYTARVTEGLGELETVVLGMAALIKLADLGVTA